MADGLTAHLGRRAPRVSASLTAANRRSPCNCAHARRLHNFCPRSPQLSRAARGVPTARLSTLKVFSGAVQQVSQEQLEKELADRQVPLIIDFYATWCGPCVLLAKELEQVAADLGDKVKVLKIDTDQNPELSSQLQIQGLPTMVFVGMDPTKPALRTEGLLAAKAIKDIVENELSAAAPAAPAA